MAGSVNKVTLIGNLGRDPEVRHTNDGNPIVNMSVATSERWRDRNSGEQRERTEWHRVVIFNERLGEVAQKYLRKGSKVYLEGQLQTRKWQDQQGQDRYSTEVVLQRYRGELTMLDSRGEGASTGDMAAIWAAEWISATASSAVRRPAGAGRSSTTKFRSEPAPPVGRRYRAAAGEIAPRPPATLSESIDSAMFRDVRTAFRPLAWNALILPFLEPRDVH